MYSLTLLVFVPLVLSPTTGAAGSECKIYVSSFNGINNTSCWTGGYQTPCVTLDLALQGTATAAGNCSSFNIIYLYLGDYTLHATAGLEKHNNVTIIGNDGSKDVSVCVPHSVSEPPSLSENECHLDLNVTIPKFCWILCSSTDYCNLQFTASVTDGNGAIIEWKNDLYVHLTYPNYSFNGIVRGTPINQTFFDVCSDDQYMYYSGNFYYQLDPGPIFKNDASPIEMTLNVSTIGPIVASTTITVTVTGQCSEPYVSSNGSCSEPDAGDYIHKCNNPQDYCPFVAVECLYYSNYHSAKCFNVTCYQYNNRPIQSDLCAYCPPGNGVSINKINKCTGQCNDLLNLLIFIGIEILPITIMVLLIIILNIQLTNGSMNGLVFYSQLIFFIYSDFVLLLMSTKNDYELLASPCSVFNLDFTPFLVDYPLCIVPNMSPLGAISFWYVIGFYPLLLLLLIYVWIVLYDKGFKCVVLITRPFHRCMARFWSMTGIEPSLIHSTASIYILCFTQLAGVSLKILRFQYYHHDIENEVDYEIINMSTNFFYDSNVKYFQDHQHVVAGSVAILVLIVVIIMPTLYIQFYRFKWFHKLLGILHLRKQLLISLGDVFTGPYKNGSDNTFDYRFFAGFYLWARVIIMSSIFLAGINDEEMPLSDLSYYYFSNALSIQGCCVLLLAIMVLIFRPFKRNIHSFSEVTMLIMEFAFLTSVFVLSNIDQDNLESLGFVITSFNCLFFGILALYIFYQLVKIMSNCYRYWKQHNRTVPANRDQEDIQSLINDDDWVADRMENPQDYDEQHVTASLVDSLPIDTEQLNTTAATYGSINNNLMQQT